MKGHDNNFKIDTKIYRNEHWKDGQEKYWASFVEEEEWEKKKEANTGGIQSTALIHCALCQFIKS